MSAPTTDTPKLLSVAEAAHRLGISKRQLYYVMRAGRIATVTVSPTFASASTRA